MALVACGQPSVSDNAMAMACWGEAGSCGQTHVISGRCVLTHWASMRALKELGEDRNPCMYSRCVTAERWGEDELMGTC